MAKPYKMKGLTLSIFLMILPSVNIAEQDRVTNGASPLVVDVSLRHRVNIPQILYFRVGSPIFNSIDEVIIDVNMAPGVTVGNNATYNGINPLGSSTPIAATTNGILQVDLRGNIGTVSITYEVSDILGLVSIAGDHIPFEQITTVSSNSNLPAPVLNNNGGAGGLATSVDVFGNNFGGKVVNLQAMWTYSYKNSILPVAGIYKGRVTYTASTP